MAVIEASFDGGMLALARLTRFAPGAKAHVRVPEPDGDGWFDCHATVTGLTDVTAGIVAQTLRRRFGDATTLRVEDGLHIELRLHAQQVALPTLRRLAEHRRAIASAELEIVDGQVLLRAYGEPTALQGLLAELALDPSATCRVHA